MTQEYLEHLKNYIFPHVYKTSVVHRSGNQVEVKVYSTEELKPCEPEQYAKRGVGYHGTDLKEVYIHVDGEDVEIEYITAPHLPFERIRRITGYLVGTLDRFNDAKRAEERERVKHGVGQTTR